MSLVSEKMPIGSIADVRMGVTLRGRDATRPDLHGSCRMIRISDISDEGQLLTSDFLRFAPAERIRPDLFLRRGDVLFPNRGTRNTALSFDLEESNIVVGAQFFVLRPDISRVLPAYLAWFLRSETSVRHFRERRKGTLVQIVQRADITDLLIPLPALEMQEKIVKINALAMEERKILNRIADLKTLQLERQLLNVAADRILR